MERIIVLLEKHDLFLKHIRFLCFQMHQAKAPKVTRKQILFEFCQRIGIRHNICNRILETKPVMTFT